MIVYRMASAEEMAVIKEYSKLFEDIKVSESVDLGGKLYKEVIFKKKGIGKSEEYLYLDGENKIVEKESIRARVARLTFFMDAYLNDEPGSIIRALQGEDEIEKNKDDLELMEEGLKLISNRCSKYNIDKGEIEKVQAILVKLLELRGKTNEKLKDFLKVVEAEMQNKKYFDEAVIDNCMASYKEVMICNYEKVQLISRAALSYGKLRGAAEKMRRGYNLRFITSHTEALMKVSYMMGYFENLIKAYGSMAKMTYNDYLKNIVNSGKINAEYKCSAIRKKQK
ncbi:MAG: hypothetical protein E6344_01890 [Clostridium sp.]|uniref:hypothetical protein n=1 Tax=Clostridium culturomicium TaxID=1499683 RepID=UPI00058E012B|nr:hypothetical protein [Clostridium culturomicium]MDU4890623.1 hypothetical protein [Clostridium sp.]MDU7082415.1 hypothetical protein [Clostridium sp.]